MTKAALIYSDIYCKYELPEGHPLRMLRLKLTYELLKYYNNMVIVEPREATKEDIMLVHSLDYINTVEKLAKEGGYALNYGLGTLDNPVFRGMYKLAKLIVGASLKGVELLAKYDHLFCMPSGLHHALPSRASGFCIFNDPAIAIKKLKQTYNKILYIDIDAHHGDGVQHIFYNNNDVLTISFHESGNYLFPGTGFLDERGSGKGLGYSINIPLLPHTTDQGYYYAFKEIVPKYAEWFNPDVVIMQCGVDTHYKDPLTHLNLTTRIYPKIIKLVHKIVHQLCNGKLILLGGGGYNLDVVSRSWTLIFAEISNLKINNNIPQEFLNYFKAKTAQECYPYLFDKEIIKETNMDYTKEVVEKILSYIS